MACGHTCRLEQDAGGQQRCFVLHLGCYTRRICRTEEIHLLCQWHALAMAQVRVLVAGRCGHTSRTSRILKKAAVMHVCCCRLPSAGCRAAKELQLC